MQSSLTVRQQKLERACSPLTHPLDRTKIVTELPARLILNAPSPALSLGAADELAPADNEAEPVITKARPSFLTTV